MNDNRVGGIMIRKSNFELLRIVAIIMIIGLHYFNGSMGGALSNVVPKTFNYYFVYLFESLFIIGVNLFILTTGYFSLNKKSINLGKLFKLILTAYFYGLIFYLCNVIYDYQSFDIKQFILAINPFLSGGYWFIKYYTILILLSPFINTLIEELNQKLIIKLIIILLLLFSIWPSFLPQAPITNGGYGLMNFIMLYIMGAYIRKYNSFQYRLYIYFLIYLICGVITFLFAISGWGSRWNYDFIFNIIGSVSLFIMFSKLEIQSNKVNYLSKFTFNVYLIHFSSFVINLIYHDILKCQNYYNSPWLIPHFIISIFVIYIFSIVIDIIRRYLIFLFGYFYKIWIKNDRIDALKWKISKLLILDIRA